MMTQEGQLKTASYPNNKPNSNSPTVYNGNNIYAQSKPRMSYHVTTSNTNAKEFGNLN